MMKPELIDTQRILAWVIETPTVLEIIRSFPPKIDLNIPC